MTVAAYQAPAGLTNPHLQTVLSSLARKQLLARRLSQFLADSQRHDLTIGDVVLRVERHASAQIGAPTICILPGWLGSASSTYVMSVAAALHAAGFSVARINLRDHGDTAHLNQGLFHSALIEEVVDLIKHLAEPELANTGVLGFSLGGNFTLRIAKHLPAAKALAICPAIVPHTTMYAIDSNPLYQRYFVRKWRSVWHQKQHAFPGRYDFGNALQLSTVSALTDYFVTYHSPFDTTASYFEAYDLSGDTLHGVGAHVLASSDDPIIGADQFQKLPASIQVDMTTHGGHGAYLSDWSLNSWVDDYIVDHFRQEFGLAA